MYMKFIHLLLSNLIGQNVQAMVIVSVISRGGGLYVIYTPGAFGPRCVNHIGTNTQ